MKNKRFKTVSLGILPKETYLKYFLGIIQRNESQSLSNSWDFARLKK